ncbi:MAG: glycosyltransferase family 39 protein [bacterium]
MRRAEEFFVRHERLFEGLFVLACFLFYFAWAAVKWENYGPDENMRLMIPRFILKHGTLPTGWEGEVLQGSWGISYGFKPTQLPAIFSALFMKLASLFGGSGDTLVVAARMTSVLAGAGGILVLFRAMGRLFSRPVKWFLVILTASIPQYAFLSSYVNNDIVAVFGTFLILWAWILAAKEGWRAKTVLLLAAGIGVVGLSYFNAFGWILMSIFYFFLTQEYPRKGEAPEVRREKRIKVFKAFLLVFCLAAAILLPLYLRNLFLHGDLLGDAATAASKAHRADPDFMASLPATPLAEGLSLWDMLAKNRFSWPRNTLRSFFGCFGFMEYYLPLPFYVFYYLIFGGGLVLFIVSLIDAFKKRTSVLAFAGVSRWKAAMLNLSAFASICITLGLYTWYAYASDYQAQGRYVYPALAGILLFLGIGYERTRRLPKAFWLALYAALIGSALAVCFFVYLKTPLA